MRRLLFGVVMAKQLRIFSWNVNGIRSVVRKGFSSWLARCGGDIVAVQEVRASSEDLPPEILRLRSWQRSFVSAERKGYSGVGLLSKRAPDTVTTAMGVPSMDSEGRLQIARFGALWLVNSYFPNGSGRDRDNGRVPFKLDYYQRLDAQLDAAFQRGEPIVVVGDFNTAQEEVDIARPRENRTTSGFLDEEREELRRWAKKGWVDSFRALHPDATGKYSWWSQRVGVREKNVGWRIDYAWLSPGAVPFLRAAAIHSAVRGSDHCPISVDLDAGVVTP